MTSLRSTLISKPKFSLSSQIEDLQEDILRFSRILTQLSEIPHQDLVRLSISEQLAGLRRSLKSIEDRCIPILGINVDEPFDPVDELSSIIPRVSSDWGAVQKEARKAKKLAHQLTSSFCKIRLGIAEHQDHLQAPDEISKINQELGDTFPELFSVFDPDQG
jgi:hypothetical protein